MSENGDGLNARAAGRWPKKVAGPLDTFSSSTVHLSGGVDLTPTSNDCSSNGEILLIY